MRGAAGVGDPYDDRLGNGGYDVKRYDIDADWDGSTLKATVRIDASVLSSSLSQFNLDFGPRTTDGSVGHNPLVTSKVTVDGRPARFVNVDGELVVVPSTVLRAKQKFTVVVTYSGRPETFATKLEGGWYQLADKTVVVFGEPRGASSWYPVNDHPTDKADYRVRIRVPAGREVVANGTGTSRSLPDGRVEWEFTDGGPRSSYLGLLLIGDFEFADGGRSARGLPIRNVFPKGTTAKYKPVFAGQPEMIDFFETWFGDYPFSSYGAAVVDHRELPAIETQTLSLFSVRILRMGDAVVSHELAHQWFGDSVGLRRWNDIWLNEGFASYAEELWAQHVDPSHDITVSLASEAKSLRGLLNVPPVNPDSSDLFNASVYKRGAMTLHALRLEVGDDVFRQILRAHAMEGRFASSDTATFIALAERESGRDLTELFRLWLNETELPATLGGVALR